MDFTSRFSVIAHALAHLPTKAAIIDAEVVASNLQGLPDFTALHDRAAKPDDICCWAFDLLGLNGGAVLRSLPLVARRIKLQKLLARHRAGFILYSDVFDDVDRLLAECESRYISTVSVGS